MGLKLAGAHKSSTWSRNARCVGSADRFQTRALHGSKRSVSDNGDPDEKPYSRMCARAPCKTGRSDPYRGGTMGMVPGMPWEPVHVQAYERSGGRSTVHLAPQAGAKVSASADRGAG